MSFTRYRLFRTGTVTLLGRVLSVSLFAALVHVDGLKCVCTNVGVVLVDDVYHTNQSNGGWVLNSSELITRLRSTAGHETLASARPKSSWNVTFGAASLCFFPHHRV